MRTTFQFDEFELDLGRRVLTRSGEVVPLKPRVFDMLAVLVQNNGNLLTKDELFQLVWGDQLVDETNLSVSISAIRKALGERASEPRYIRNVSGRGYYFDADLQSGNEKGEAIAPPTNGGVGNGNGSATASAAASVEEKKKPYVVRHLAGIAIGAAGTVVLIGLLFAAYSIYSRRGDIAPTTPLTVARLTSTGRVPKAALSPDGKWFVYVRSELDGRQGLYLSQIDGSSVVQLRAPSDKIYVSLAFTPDQTKVYYTLFDSNVSTQGTMYRMPTIGGVSEEVRGGMPTRSSFSPDGAEIAYVHADKATRSATLEAMTADGSSTRILGSFPSGQGLFTSGVAWSPDGRSIAVAAADDDEEPSRSDIFTFDAADGGFHRVTSEGWNSIRSMAWNKSSSGIVGVVGLESSDLEKQIWYIPISGKPQVLLADSNAYSSLEIARNSPVMIAVQTQTLSNVYVAPAGDLAAAKQVTFDMLGKQSGWDGVDWTDDQIIYAARNGRNVTLWQMQADGSEQKQLLPESRRSAYPSLPSDMNFIVFESNRTGTAQVWRSKLDGSDLVQLTSTGENVDPHISPDGRFIVYTATRATENRLFLMRSDGTDAHQLTDLQADWARFSPDSRSIAFGNYSDGKQTLAVIGLEGGVPYKTFDVPQTANFRLGVRWTPDGKAVTYRDWLNGIWKQDLAGGEPTRLPGLPAEKLFAYAWSRDGKWLAYSRGASLDDVVKLTFISPTAAME